jgi:hypothetical protein
MLAGVAGRGFAMAHREVVKTSCKTIEVSGMRITNAGRQAIES